MIGKLFAQLSEIIQNFALAVGQAFSSAIDLIYDGEEITPLGVLILVGLGTGLLIWGFKFIRRLIRVRTK